MNPKSIFKKIRDFCGFGPHPEPSDSVDDSVDLGLQDLENLNLSEEAALDSEKSRIWNRRRCFVHALQVGAFILSLVTASTGSAICAYLFLILVGYHFWILFKYVRDKGIYLGAAGSTLGILIGDVLVVVLGFAFVYIGVGVQETLAEGCSHAFRDCLYFSIVSFSTLGYGDFQPIPDIRILAATEGLFGYLLLGLLVGLLASSASSKISRSSNLRKSESQYPSSDEDDFTL